MKVMLDMSCPHCQHSYEVEAMDPVVNGEVLETFLGGSSTWYCEGCDSPEVEIIRWRKVRHLSLVPPLPEGY